MEKQVKSSQYNLAHNLTEIMKCHPKTGVVTTQKTLADAIEVRPQTVSLYASGTSQPTAEILYKIALYFDISVDRLITGVSSNNMPVWYTLGLSERTAENLKLVKDNYFEDTPGMLAVIDYLLGDKDFYITIEKVSAWLAKKELAADKDMEKFFEWQAVQYLQGYLLDIFGYNLRKMYNKLKGECEND